MIAQELEVSLHMAFMDARQKRHELITVEHLLLAMLDNPSASDVLKSCGANIESKNFYLNLKAEIENAVLDLDLNSTSIFRPSLLLGKRKESRFGENIAQIIMPLISFMMPSIYKPIKAKDVAKAIIQISKKTISGVKIYHYDEMINSKEI